jgi:UDP:flavonoid glycosyltransferase YjiC (YdhE family)
MFPRVLAQPQRDWPPNTVVTGAIIHDVAHGRRLSPEVEEFLARGDAPLVFTLGSAAVLVGEDFYRESVSAVTSTGCRAMLLVGEDLARQLQPELPKTMMAIAAAPHSLLFPRASVIAHHCGIGTLSQSLLAGRPLLAVPFAHDQPDNAHRAARLGVARIVHARQYRAGRVARELRELLDDPAYGSSAARVGAQVREEDGAGNACAAIERVLAGVSDPRTSPTHRA